MRICTAKKIIRGKQEFTTLISSLKKDGYTWANGDDLLNSIDTNYLMNHFPHLLFFDAKNKKVYYSSSLNYEFVEIDPNYR